MKILFLHQNFPAQFMHVAPELLRRGHDVLALTSQGASGPFEVPCLFYPPPTLPIDPAINRFGLNMTISGDRGRTVAHVAADLRRQGYVPDVIVGHCGWGEMLFLRHVWPEAKTLAYSEFYYAGEGCEVGFDPEFNDNEFEEHMIALASAAPTSQTLLHVDLAVSPTAWQRSTHPPALLDRIEVCFDGIRTDVARPDPRASFTLPNGRVLTRADEVVTFVSRHLEPYRGYHIFLRSLPELLRRRPEAQVVIVGADGIGYGGPSPEGGGWKRMFLREVEGRLDMSRVHFLNQIPYPSLIRLFQVTRAHAYLSYPFVLSWSMLEAMSAGALVVGSDTAPVREVIQHGKNGLLVDFFDVHRWSDVLADVLAAGPSLDPLRAAARVHVVQTYDLSVCLPRMVSIIEKLGLRP